MSNPLDDERTKLADKLATVVDVTLDPRTVPPFVRVGVPTITTPTDGSQGWQVAYPVTVVAPGPGNADALTWLLDNVWKVLTVLSGRPTAFPGELDVGGKLCPSYTINVDAYVDNC